MFALKSEMNYKMEMLPSGELTFCDGKSPFCSWENPLFQWPFSMSLFVCSPEGNPLFSHQGRYNLLRIGSVQLSSVLGILHHHTADLKRFFLVPLA